MSPLHPSDLAKAILGTGEPLSSNEPLELAVTRGDEVRHLRAEIERLTATQKQAAKWIGQLQAECDRLRKQVGGLGNYSGRLNKENATLRAALERCQAAMLNWFSNEFDGGRQFSELTDDIPKLLAGAAETSPVDSHSGSKLNAGYHIENDRSHVKGTDRPEDRPADEPPDRDELQPMRAPDETSAAHGPGPQDVRTLCDAMYSPLAHAYAECKVCGWEIKYHKIAPL